MKNIFVVGRHTSAFPTEFNVVGSENVTFPNSVEECKIEILRLISVAGDAALVFQAAPGIAILALIQLTAVAAVVDVLEESQADHWQLWMSSFTQKERIGFVISKPGERPTGVTREFSFNTVEDGEVAKKAILMANPNAKILETQPVFSGVGYTPEKLTVTFDPPMRFEFDRIEWL